VKRYVLKAFALFSGRFGQPVIRYRLPLVVAVQLAMVLVANALALALRFDGDIPPPYRDLALKCSPLVAAVYMGALWAFESHRGLWRYVGLHDLTRILGASVAGTLCIYVVLQRLSVSTMYPRSVIIMTGVLMAGLLAGIRLGVRWFREWLHIVGPTARRVLVIGAGHAGEALIRQLQTDPSYNYKPVGILDDDPAKQRARIQWVRVMGPVSELRNAVAQIEAHEIIVAIPSASTALRQRVLEAAEGITVPLKTLPNVRRILADPRLM
jgi:FlaA1/EpsC-like NDP-sugar epimerase